MNGDASGRIPLFFVADGIYALRLTDQHGVQTNGGFFYPQIPSIGASTSGGGGTPVDPTTVFSTGDWKWRPSAETLTGWVRLNGRTIGNAASGASERANADTQALYLYTWGTYVDAICPVPGGRGANALADFNANKQITLLDMRGRAPFGLDDMGNAALNAFTGVAFTKGNATTGGSSGGVNSTTLSLAQIPAGITSAGLNGIAVTPSGFFILRAGNALIVDFAGPGGSGLRAPGNTSSMDSTAPFLGNNNIAVTSNNTLGQAFPSVPSAMLGSHFWKL